MKFFRSSKPVPDEEIKNGGLLLTVEHASKRFGKKEVLKDLSLTLRKGETLTVLGRSGEGKSVLLKLVSGLLIPENGTVVYRGKNVPDASERQLAELRGHMGFLFQGGALFDSMTVGQNLELFLVSHTRLSPKEREEKILHALEMVELFDVIDLMPSELSGGMKKRAGLARSIVLEPEMMLYDEPTTGLDPLTAASIAELILSLQTKLGIASIVVTHDLPTAFTVSDRTLVLNGGVAVFEGTMPELAKSSDEFLHKYLDASRLDLTRRERILNDISENAEHSTNATAQLETPSKQ